MPTIWEDVQHVQDLAGRMAPRPARVRASRRDRFANWFQYISAMILGLAVLMILLAIAVVMLRAAWHSQISGLFWWLGVNVAFFAGAWWRSYRYRLISDRITARMHDSLEARLNGQRAGFPVTGPSVRNSVGKP